MLRLPPTVLNVTPSDVQTLSRRRQFCQIRLVAEDDSLLALSGPANVGGCLGSLRYGARVDQEAEAEGNDDPSGSADELMSTDRDQVETADPRDGREGLPSVPRPLVPAAIIPVLPSQFPTHSRALSLADEHNQEQPEKTEYGRTLPLAFLGTPASWIVDLPHRRSPGDRQISQPAYNDAAPAQNQPQTPRDLSLRHRTRLDGVRTMPPQRRAPAELGSPSVAVQRRPQESRGRSVSGFDGLVDGGENTDQGSTHRQA